MNERSKDKSAPSKRNEARDRLGRNGRHDALQDRQIRHLLERIKELESHLAGAGGGTGGTTNGSGGGQTDAVVFVDLLDAEEAERARLEERATDLRRIRKQRDGELDPALDSELNEITAKLKGHGIVDPLFKGARRVVASGVGDHSQGKMPSQAPNYAMPSGQTPSGVRGFSDQELELAAVFGILSVDGVKAPPYHLLADDKLPAAVVAAESRSRAEFGDAVWGAQGEYKHNRDLYRAVLPHLIAAGDTAGGNRLKASEWVLVVRGLMRAGCTATTYDLEPQIQRELLRLKAGDVEREPSRIEIDLPDLEEETSHDIQATNIIGLQPGLVCAMFEELKVFQVVDKLVELFQNGMLPITRGNAGDFLYRYWKESATRVGEAERRAFYGRAFGIPGGDDGGMPNREFNDLWLRFVSSVSSFLRQNSLDDLLRARVPGAISQQQVRKAARDLAANLSLHGYGMTYFLGTELQRTIKDVIKLLSDEEIRAAYGAKDMWQVIDQVAMLELGGAKNSVRYRTMATAGAVIIAWLSTHANELARTGYGVILDVNAVHSPTVSEGHKPTLKPTDYDLFNACEQWLAVTGTDDTRVEEYAQPHEAPMMTSKPIQIPSVAREMLESVGVSGLGVGAGYRH